MGVVLFILASSLVAARLLFVYARMRELPARNELQSQGLQWLDYWQKAQQTPAGAGGRITNTVEEVFARMGIKR